MSTKQNKFSFFTKLAFQQADINLGSTSSNPSVGCVIVHNDSVISSGHTSQHGRPHAEANALNQKLNFKNSILFSSLEPCSHYGKTGPCTKKIIKNKIKKVVFSVPDHDPRSANKAQDILKKNKIFVKKNVLINYGRTFYQSYNNNVLPYLDGKIAISKDFFSINKKNKFITNEHSRKIGNFLRSKYDCLLTTSKTVNADDPLLNCRLEGLTHKSPQIAILDRGFKINLNLKIIKEHSKKVFLIINKENKKKEIILKRRGVKILKIKDKNNKLRDLLIMLKKNNFNRIFVESGLTFINNLIKNKLINRLYIFQSMLRLAKKGDNKSSPSNIKKLIKKNNKIEINLKGDTLYQIKI